MFARILAALVAVCVSVAAFTAQAQQQKGVACKRNDVGGAMIYIMSLDPTAGTATIGMQILGGRPEYFSDIKGAYINGRLKFQYVYASFDVEVRSDSLIGDVVGYGHGAPTMKGAVWHCDSSPLQLAHAH